MLKELILAIIIGALLGIGLTGGYLVINKRTSNSNNPPIITSPTPTPKTTDLNKDFKSDDLIIDYVENYDIVNKEELVISGTTNSNSTVIITLKDEILSDTSDDKGKFEFNLSLNSGLNIIKITVVDSQDNQFEKTLNITYSTADI